VKTYVASKNAGKLVEMRAIFAGSALDLDTYEQYRDVEEGSSSYIDNALLKARSLAEQLHAAGIQAAVLSDDSGIEVDAMDRRPGVLSARYAGAGATWTQRLALMLEELRGVPDAARTARFVCAMALVLPGGAELVATGIVEGVVAHEEHGVRGFGYDPIFYFPPRDCTFAELAADEKNALSHRRRAADALLTTLHEHA